MSTLAKWKLDGAESNALLTQDKVSLRRLWVQARKRNFAQCTQLRDEQRGAHDDAARARLAAGFRQVAVQSAANKPVTCMSNGSATSYGNTASGNLLLTQAA